MRIKIKFDFGFGFFYDSKKKWLYIFPLPFFCIILKSSFFYNQELNELGEQIFGSEKEFFKWLKRKNFVLNNQKPIDLLENTDSGINLILEELKRIEFGATA
jgi:hypothetical protein